MPGRRALIIGSECDALNKLDFPAQLAPQLCEELIHRGDWLPIRPDRPVVVNPTIIEFKDAVREAFEIADAESAQLLIAFIGHGISTRKSDYYLQAIDSPAVPDPDYNFAFGETLRVRLDGSKYLDGLIVLVDACVAGDGVQGVAERAVEVVGEVNGRMEVLTASGTGSAYAGCFTRTMLRVFQSGLTRSGEELLASDLLAPIREACPSQLPRRLGFDGGGVVADQLQEDVGLWLTRNLARPKHALTGRPAAGLLDQVTRNVTLSPQQRSVVADMMDRNGQRLRALQGPAGAGKTTVMAFLIRPTERDTPTVAGSLVKAAIFLDATSTPESIATELAAQLHHTVEAFPAAYTAVNTELDAAGDTSTDSIDRQLRLPLQRCRASDTRICILIDGIDQVGQAQTEQVRQALTRLATPNDDTLNHVRLILGARTDYALTTSPGLEHAIPFTLAAPTWNDLSASTEHSTPDTREIDGGWLAVRLNPDLQPGADLEQLAIDYLQTQLDRASDPDTMHAVVALLAAAGTGPILPFTILHRALGELGHTISANRIRDILVNLGPLIQRGNAGTTTEHVGLAHARILTALTHDQD
ncbi:MAG: ATP-binding protein [Jatrophihabitantaceae bacterium]